MVLESVSVDGTEISIEAAREVGPFEEVAFKSVSPHQQLLGMCKGWKNDCLSRVEHMETLSSLVLKRDWNDSQGAGVELLEQLRPLVEGLGVLLDFGKNSSATWEQSLSVGFEAGVGSINTVVDSIESRDCVVLSDCLAFQMKEAWERLASCLDEEVIPILEKELSS